MATEYVLYGSADLTPEEMRLFLAGVLGAAVAEDGMVHRPGLQVTAYRAEPGEEAYAASLFGFTHRVTATFRFSNRSTEEETEHNTALMAAAVLEFLDRYAGFGVLLFNGEEVVLQKLDGRLALNSDWEDWSASPEMNALIGEREFRALPQPLL